jgi:hypothetical protein
MLLIKQSRLQSYPGVGGCNRGPCQSLVPGYTCILQFSNAVQWIPWVLFNHIWYSCVRAFHTLEVCKPDVWILGLENDPTQSQWTVRSRLATRGVTDFYHFLIESLCELEYLPVPFLTVIGWLSTQWRKLDRAILPWNLSAGKKIQRISYHLPSVSQPTRPYRLSSAAYAAVIFPFCWVSDLEVCLYDRLEWSLSYHYRNPARLFL